MTKRKLREAETMHYGQNSTALEAYNNTQQKHRTRGNAWILYLRT